MCDRHLLGYHSWELKSVAALAANECSLNGPQPVVKTRNPGLVKDIRIADPPRLGKLQDIPRATRVTRVKPAGVLSSCLYVPPEPAKSSLDLVISVASRAGGNIPPVIPSVTSALYSFVLTWILPRLKPLLHEHNDYVEWVNAMPWPKVKRDALIRWADEQLAWLPWAISRGMMHEKESEALLSHVYSIFQKKEFYDLFDVTRTIFGMSDWIRVMYGHVLKRINAELLHSEFTLHGIAVKEWVRVIWESMSPTQRLAFATDFSGFERIFWAIMKTALIFLPTMVMAPHSDDMARVWKNIWEELRSNKISCKRFFVQLYRMVQKSGAHDTYGGNTHGHIILFLFVDWFFLGKLPRFVPTAMVENASSVLGRPDRAHFLASGDDGVGSVGPEENMQHSLMYRALGIVQTTEPNAGQDQGLGQPILYTSFCSSNIAEGFGGEALLVVDPLKYIPRLGWISNLLASARTSKKLAMVKAQALSYLHRAPSTPVLAALCGTFLMRPEVRNLDVRSVMRHFDSRKRSEVEAALADAQFAISACRVDGRFQAPTWNGMPVHPLFKAPSPDAYCAVERQFGLPALVQREIEAGMSWKGLDCPILSRLYDFVPMSYRNNYALYTVNQHEAWTPLFYGHQEREKWKVYIEACGGDSRRLNLTWLRGEVW